MATLTLSYGAVQTMAVPALQSLASSQTVGWQSAVVDNTSNLYVDALVQAILDFAATAPANDRAAYLYAYGALETGYTNPASGAEGAITLTNIGSTGQNLRLIGVIPYTTTDEIVESSLFSVAAAFGGVLPPKWGLVLMNFSGAALAAGGNTVKWVGLKATAA